MNVATVTTAVNNVTKFAARSAFHRGLVIGSGAGLTVGYFAGRTNISLSEAITGGVVAAAILGGVANQQSSEQPAVVESSKKSIVVDTTATVKSSQ